MKLLLVLMVGSILFLNGCAAIIATSMVTNSENQKTYAVYLDGAQKNNTTREKAGLTPEKVMTYAEWQKAMKPPTKK